MNGAGWFSVTTALWPLGLARIVYGLLWWQQSKWKVPSDDFGRKSGGGLWYWVHQEIQFPTVGAYKDFLVNVMIPNWTFFGWMTLITETFIGVTLILGLFTRLGALVALGMAANITVGILSVPHEWGWTYTMLIMLAAHLPPDRRGQERRRGRFPGSPARGDGVPGQPLGQTALMADVIGLSVGVGLTNACDLACAHCYRETERIDQLTPAEVESICDSLPVRSINLGTGENGLHPDYAAVVELLRKRGVKLSLTSNGFTIDRSSDDTLRSFSEVEVSIDFPTEAEQDAFRGRGNWKRVMAGIERLERLGITVTVLSVMMKTNYRRLPEIAKVAFDAGANYRVNVYQPVKTDAFTLSYEEFWDGFRRLLAATRLVSTTEPILNAMLGAPFRESTGCGRRTVRVSPRGDVIPCVYWASSDVRLEDLPALRGDGVLDSTQFARVRTIPEECRGCEYVDTCQGGCAGRRELAGGIERADPYCPLVRGKTVDLQWTPAERRELLKTGSACTTVLAPL